MARPTSSARLSDRHWRTPAVPFLVAGGLIVSACSNFLSSSPDDRSPSTVDTANDGGGDDTAASGIEAALLPALNLDVPNPDSIYDPVRGGEELPDGYRQLLKRDAIAPVYNPEFVGASGVDWPEDSLVIGVELDGEARAYPVGFLNRREMVNDNHRGIPTLVTW